MDFEARTISVQGTEISLENGIGSDIYVSKNLSDDMDKVSSQIAWWSSVKAAAIAEQELVDANYRNWRAKKAKALLGTREGEKLAEWKIKNEIDGDDDFLKFKGAISKAAENVAAADGMFQAFLRKSNILQSLGASLRAERDTVEVATKANGKARKPVVELEDDEDELEAQGGAETKTEEEPPPRRRGRPPGTKNKGSAKVLAPKDPKASEEYYKKEAAAAEEEEPPKRKRGRPPGSKNKAKADEAEVAEAAAGDPPKRKPGRPKKVQPSVEAAADSEAEEVDLDDDDDDFPESYGKNPKKEVSSSKREKMLASIKAKRGSK